MASPPYLPYPTTLSHSSFSPQTISTVCFIPNSYNPGLAAPTYMSYKPYGVVNNLRLEGNDSMAMITEGNLSAEVKIQDLTKEKEALGEKLNKCLSKLSEKEREVEKLNGEVEKLDSYLRELPTREDFKELIEQTQEMEEHKNEMEVKLKQVHEAYKGAKKDSTAKNQYIMMLEEQNKQLKLKVKECSTPLSTPLAVSETLDNFGIENKDLQTQNLKKLFEITQDKLNKLKAQHISVVSNLQEKIEQEINVNKICQADLEEKEKVINLYKDKVALMSNENNSLLEKNIRLSGDKKTNEIAESEICLAVKKLNFLVWNFHNIGKALKQRLNGEIVDLELLIHVQEFNSETPDLEATKQKLKFLDNEIDRLRNVVLDLYAKDCQQNLPSSACITQ